MTGWPSELRTTPLICFLYDRWAIWIGRSPPAERSLAVQTEILLTWDSGYPYVAGREKSNSKPRVVKCVYG